MAKAYLSYNNIVSALGFDSYEVFKQMSLGKSGLNIISDPKLFTEPICSSVVNTSKLDTFFEGFVEDNDNYTRLEKMMMCSLHQLLQESKIEITSKTGLVISTTKGNIDVLEASSGFPKERAYLHVLGQTIKNYFGFKNEAIVLSNACISGIQAVTIAKRYIDAKIFDDVLIVAVDLVSKFTLSGFRSFQALSSSPCQPYSKNRNGINIGEAAASVLVTSKMKHLVKESVEILGGSTCNDANHISGPSRTGEGMVRSVATALKESNISAEQIDYICAHGTATLYNDEMEAIAYHRLGLSETPLNSLKGYFGHTLGASGLLETIIGMHSLQNNTLLRSIGFDELGVSKPMNIVEKNTIKELDYFLKTAAGFGGSNTAVIFKKTEDVR